MSNVGPNIKKIRGIKKLSQNRLAKLAGISQPALSAIESGSANPSAGTVELLAGALGCTVSELIGETPSGDAYSAAERQLVREYRTLNPQGREYIRQQMTIALQLYSGESAPAAAVAK